MKHYFAYLIGLCLLSVVTGCGPTRNQPVQNTAVPGASTALFQDVAAQAGIQFTHSNGADGHLHFMETTPAGCAFLDYDNDGFLDILLIQSGPISPLAPGQTRPHCALYHNNGNGTFTDVTANSGLDKDLGYGHGIAIADYDNDGYDDLFITSYPHNFLFHNEHGTGRFTDVTHPMGLDRVSGTGYATSAAFGDYDNDGKLDLYICYYSPWTLANDPHCKDGLGQPDYCNPQVFEPQADQLFHNDGKRFVNVTHQAGIDKEKGRGLAVTFFDYDGDGRADMFVANDLNPNILWHNNGNGTFTNVALQAGVAYSDSGHLMSGMGIGLADYDHSGRESLFVSNFSDMPNMLYKNLGHGLFEDVSNPSGLALPHMMFLTFGCEFLDYDADGWPDLINANGHIQYHPETTLAGVTFKERKQLFHNGGSGTFQEVRDPALLGDLAKQTVSRGLVVGDYDNNGRLDVLVNNQNDRAQLFHNNDHSAYHWVSFKPIGTKSNRDGFGAIFSLRAGKMQQTASVHSGTSYLSSSDRRVYFGLGAASQIDSVEVRWPSGTRETLKHVMVDQSVVVTEGKGITAVLPKSKTALHTSH